MSFENGGAYVPSGSEAPEGGWRNWFRKGPKKEKKEGGAGSRLTLPSDLVKEVGLTGPFTFNIVQPRTEAERLHPYVLEDPVTKVRYAFDDGNRHDPDNHDEIDSEEPKAMILSGKQKLERLSPDS